MDDGDTDIGFLYYAWFAVLTTPALISAQTFLDCEIPRPGFCQNVAWPVPKTMIANAVQTELQVNCICSSVFRTRTYVTPRRALRAELALVCLADPNDVGTLDRQQNMQKVCNRATI